MGCEQCAGRIIEHIKRGTGPGIDLDEERLAVVDEEIKRHDALQFKLARQCHAGVDQPCFQIFIQCQRTRSTAIAKGMRRRGRSPLAAEGEGIALGADNAEHRDGVAGNLFLEIGGF